MSRYSKVLALLIGFYASTPTNAQTSALDTSRASWIWVSTNQQGGTIYLRAEPLNISSDGIISIWLKEERSTYSVGNTNYRNVTIYYLNGYSCLDKTFALWSKVVLNANNQMIQRVNVGTNKEYGLAVPDTIDESVLNEVCRKYSKKNKEGL
jgi:hypothetical protein